MKRLVCFSVAILYGCLPLYGMEPFCNDDVRDRIFAQCALDKDLGVMSLIRCREVCAAWFNRLSYENIADWCDPSIREAVPDRKADGYREGHLMYAVANRLRG